MCMDQFYEDPENQEVEDVLMEDKPETCSQPSHKVWMCERTHDIPDHC